MCVCLCVSMHRSMCLCAHIHVHVCEHICVSMHICMCVHKYLRTCACVWMCMCACLCVPMHTRVGIKEIFIWKETFTIILMINISTLSFSDVQNRRKVPVPRLGTPAAWAKPSGSEGDVGKWSWEWGLFSSEDWIAGILFWFKSQHERYTDFREGKQHGQNDNWE